MGYYLFQPIVLLIASETV